MLCLFECVEKKKRERELERGEINPMLFSILVYEFIAAVWASHCLNNNLINPVFISFTELSCAGREGGSEEGGRAILPENTNKRREGTDRKRMRDLGRI